MRGIPLFLLVLAFLQPTLAQEPHHDMQMPGMADHTMHMHPQSLTELIEQHSTAGTDAQPPPCPTTC